MLRDLFTVIPEHKALAYGRSVPVRAEVIAEAPPVPAIVSVSHLTKAYRPRVAVEDVSFELAPGVTGLLGPNGAGKSTLVKCMAGLCSWDRGDIRIAGIDPVWRARDARRQVGFMPERVAFPPEMSVQGYLRYVAKCKHIHRSERQSATENAIDWAGLAGVRSRIIANLSKGYRQRVGLAQALVGEPPVLILDEPSAGLDPLHVSEFRDVLRRYARSRVVVVSTHILPETRVLCDRVLVLSQGRLVYDGSTAALTTAGTRKVKVRVEGVDTGGSLPVIDQPGAALLERSGGEGHFDLLIATQTDVAVGHLVAGLTASGWLVLSIEPAGDAIEEAFRLAVVGAQPPDGAQAHGEQQ